MDDVMQDGEDVVVELDAADLPSEEFVYDDDSLNLAPDFAEHPEGQEALKKIARQVVRDFDSAWEASEEYRDQMAKDWAIFAGNLPKKQFPYENCANMHVPIMLENLSRIATRAYGELFSDWQNVFSVIPTSPEYQDEADLLTKHGNWQIREQITDFPRQQERGLLSFLVVGDVTAHSFYNEDTRLNEHQILLPDTFVTPYTYVTTKPDYSDIPWKCKVLHMYRHELERKRRQGWYDVDKVLEKSHPSWTDEPTQRMAEAVANVNGVDIPEDDPHAPFKILWYEGWCELPNQDEQRFVQVIMDYNTQCVLRLTIHEQENWQDRARYDRQLEERAAYFQALGQYQATMLQLQSQQLEMEAQQLKAQLGMVPDPGMPMDPQQGFLGGPVTPAMPGMAPEPPVPPAWMQNPEDPTELPERPRREPIQLFSHAVCIEPLVGSLGISFGRIQAHFNRAANTALNQFADSATLANVWSIIAAQGVEFETPFSMSPGKINRVKSFTGTNLRENFIELKPAPASEQLVNLVDRMVAYGQSSIQAPSVLSGEAGKSGETYRGLSARIEQATKQLSVTTAKYAEFLRTILKNNAALNARFLQDDEMFFFVDPASQTGQQLQVSRRMYERNYHVRLEADLRFATQAQKIQEADEMLQFPMMVPPLQQNLGFIYAAAVKALKARGQSELIPMLGPPPTPPTSTFGLPPPPPPGMAPMGPDGAPMGPGGPGEGQPLVQAPSGHQAGAPPSPGPGSEPKEAPTGPANAEGTG